MYLRRFADPRDRVKVLRRSTGEVFLASVTDIAKERDFYTFTSERTGQPSFEIEHLLSRVEMAAAAALRRVTSIAFVFPPQPSDFVAVSHFIAFQPTRGPKVRRTGEVLGDLWAHMQFSDLSDQEARELLEGRGDPFDDSEVRQVVDLSGSLEDLEFIPGTDTHVEGG